MGGMSSMRTIPRVDQRDEPWANGAGVTTVVLREPDGPDWKVRISVATVEHDGPFSALPGTRRVLVPLDAPMTLRFPDGHDLHAARMGVLVFDGEPAPTGLLPEGATRDFNLMLRGGAGGDVLARTLIDSMVLPRAADLRWLVYLAHGSATVKAGPRDTLELEPGDAALVGPASGDAPDTLQITGAGEIVLARLYARAQPR